MNDVFAGMIVADANGPIGVVQSVEPDPATGAARVVVQRDDGEVQLLQPGMYMVVGDVLHIDEVEERDTGVNTVGFDPGRTQELPAIGATSARQTADIAPGDELHIPIIREEAVVRTREVERGGVRVHKTVNEREEVVEQPTFHEDVDVERIPIGRVVERAPEVREEGATLIIPVMEEMLVVEKRLVLKEEIRITRRRTEEVEQARIILREEQATVEEIGEREVGE